MSNKLNLHPLGIGMKYIKPVRYIYINTNQSTCPVT